MDQVYFSDPVELNAGHYVCSVVVFSSVVDPDLDQVKSGINMYIADTQQWFCPDLITKKRNIFQ